MDAQVVAVGWPLKKGTKQVMITRTLSSSPPSTILHHGGSSHNMSIIDFDANHMIKESTASRTEEEHIQMKHRKAANGFGHEERLEMFKDNLRFVDEHNADQNRSYRVGLNRFADLSNDEYRGLYLGTRPDPKRRLVKARTPSNRCRSR